MAQISFDQIDSYERSRGSSADRIFDFFSLKNHGDKALVRILYNDISDFMFYSYHLINGSNRNYRINCLRTDRDDINTCPLCASGYNTKTSLFIPMVQYFTENGQLTQKLVVWERSSAYRKKLQSFMNDYGPLSDVLVTITRDGAPGSKDTTYNILPANPKMYPNEAYPIDSTILENRRNLSILGTLIWDKNEVDINTFLQTGNFPMPVQQNTTQTTQNLPNFNTNAAIGTIPVQPMSEQPPIIPPAPPTIAEPAFVPQQPYAPTPQPTQTPFAAPSNPVGDATATNRPRRYY